jgi:hypothetical protein
VNRGRIALPRHRRVTTASLRAARIMPRRVLAVLSGSSRTGLWRRRDARRRRGCGLNFPERAQSTLEAELAEERHRREVAERERKDAQRERDELRRRLDAPKSPRRRGRLARPHIVTGSLATLPPKRRRPPRKDSAPTPTDKDRSGKKRRAGGVAGVARERSLARRPQIPLTRGPIFLLLPRANPG